MWGHANIKGFIINCIYSFIFTGSYYHFWFFPALIFSVVSTTLIFRIGLKKAIIPLSIVLYIIGCLGCSYYKLGIHIPILGNLYTNAHFTVIRRVILMAFPFFISGYTVFKIKNSVSKNSQTKKPIFFWIISFICWLAEIEIVRYFGLQANIVITFGLYLLVISTLLTLLNHPLPKYNKLSHQSRMLSNFTYYSHPLFITCLSAIFSNFFHIEISQTPLFVLTVLITCIFSLIICKFNNKYINLFVK